MTNNVQHHPEHKYKRLIQGYFEIRQEIKDAELFHTQKIMIPDKISYTLTNQQQR